MHLCASPAPLLSLSPSVRHCSETLLSRVSLVYCVTVACWIAEDRCVCHANVSWYPHAYDMVSTLWKKPQTLAIKSTSVSNNNVLYVTRLYVGGEICGKKKKTMHHSSLKNTYRTSSRQRWWRTCVLVSPSLCCVYMIDINEKSHSVQRDVKSD